MVVNGTKEDILGMRLKMPEEIDVLAPGPCGELGSQDIVEGGITRVGKEKESGRRGACLTQFL